MRHAPRHVASKATRGEHYGAIGTDKTGFAGTDLAFGPVANFGAHHTARLVLDKRGEHAAAFNLDALFGQYVQQREHNIGAASIGGAEAAQGVVAAARYKGRIPLLVAYPSGSQYVAGPLPRLI